jgi:outer membrane lipoprotein-sorting protein
MAIYEDMKHTLLTPMLWASLLSLSLVFPATAQEITVAQINAYLNSFATARTTFTQVNDDGSVSTGELLMRRPGRARFDYDDTDALVIAGGGQVAIFDPVSNARPEQYPLSRTPLTHILARTVDLTRSGQLAGHDYDGTTTSVVLQDPDRPELGNIRLVFTPNPVTLREWIISNESGGQTTVMLDAFTTGVDIGVLPFSILREIEARGLN